MRAENGISKSVRVDILLIEDDPDIRETLTLILEFEGYSVAHVSDGSQGLEFLMKMNPPGLILLDLMMPVMNGYEFLKRKQTSSLKSVQDIPVVILSARHELSQELEGIQGILKKPVEIQDLLGAVQKFFPKESVNRPPL